MYRHFSLNQIAFLEIIYGLCLFQPDGQTMLPPLESVMIKQEQPKVFIPQLAAAAAAAEQAAHQQQVS